MLHCHSYYSFLQGASSPEDLVAQAKVQGWTSLALTDCGGLYGASVFYRACQREGIHPVIGAQVTLEDGGQVVLLCENMTGYRNLSRIITDSYVEKGIARARITETEGLFCLADNEAIIEEMLSLFGERLYIELTRHHQEGDLARCHRLYKLGIPCVASNAVRYATREDAQLFDVITCIRHGVTIEDSVAVRAGNSERYLKSPEEMEELFAPFPGVMERSQALAATCQIDLDFSSYRFPDFPVPEGESGISYLRKLCEQKLPDCAVRRAKLDEELRLIEKLEMVGYFLIVWDIVEYAKKLGIPAQGRGSAANSLVAYLLGITPVDPVTHGLFLGRFIHEGMTTVPDIDLDFAATRGSGMPDREDVIQYVYQKYGADHVAMVCTFITFQKRLAAREVGKVLELPPDNPHYLRMVEAIIGLPRHPSIHVGGMIIASRPIAELVPLEPARMEGRVVCQWDKDMIEDAGLIKVDILSLGMLAVLRDAGVDLSKLTYDDPEVYAMIARADTIGLFQVESRAQMQSLPRTAPRNLPELAIQVAIIRPGPLQGNMVQPYIRRRQGKEAVAYPHPCLKPVLAETLGVILFQEQVLQVATAMASFSQSEAANLRRAMSRKRSYEAMEALRARFISGAAANNVPAATANETFSLLLGFASYGFCKSHALSFASIAYQSAYLKRYHPAAFAAAILNNQPMGFYPNEVILEDAKRHGIEILPVDVRHSQPRTIAHGNTIRLGLLMIKGISEETAAEITSGAPLSEKTTELLIRAGAMGDERRSQYWKLWGKTANVPSLPHQSAWDRLLDEYATIGLSTRGHPLAFLRPGLEALGYASSLDLLAASNRSHVQIAGLQICRQKPPTAKGFVFLTLEDEHGLINVVIPPSLYQSHKSLIKQAHILGIRGQKESVDGVINLRLTSLQAITPH